MSDDTQRAIEIALIEAAATTPFDEIRLETVAAAAGTTLAEIRRLYDDRFDVLAAFARRIDVAVQIGRAHV